MSFPIKRVTILILVCAVGLYAFTSLIRYLSTRSPTTLSFQVPNGFSGPFILIEDPKGIRLESRWGRINIPVPSSGILYIQSIDPLRQEWSSILAASPDGTVLPYEGHARKLQSSDRALRGFRFDREFIEGKDIVSFEFWIGVEDEDFAVTFHKLRKSYRVQQKSAPSTAGSKCGTIPGKAKA